VPIIALPATAKDGTISRIVPMLKQGAGVVTTRNHVRYIVTEYGVADLFARSVRERVHSLVNIAAPQFREELLLFAKEQHYI
jgi:acetyl-CoA hydrolase